MLSGIVRSYEWIMAIPSRIRLIDVNEMVICVPVCTYGNCIINFDIYVKSICYIVYLPMK